MTRLTKPQIVDMLKDRDGDKCFLCKNPFSNKDITTLDHWIPKSQGGSDDLENLRLAHKKCNTLKSDLIPNEDGTLPIREKRIKPEDARKIKKQLQASICHRCDNGRKLNREEVCVNCGSSAGPHHAPRYLKRNSRDCDHNEFWCWACSIGIVERRSAIMELVIGKK